MCVCVWNIHIISSDDHHSLTILFIHYLSLFRVFFISLDIFITETVLKFPSFSCPNISMLILSGISVSHCFNIMHQQLFGFNCKFYWSLWTPIFIFILRILSQIPFFFFHFPGLWSIIFVLVIHASMFPLDDVF